MKWRKYSPASNQDASFSDPVVSQRQGRGDAKAEFYDFFKEALAVILTVVNGWRLGVVKPIFVENASDPSKKCSDWVVFLSLFLRMETYFSQGFLLFTIQIYTIRIYELGFCHPNCIPNLLVVRNSERPWFFRIATESGHSLFVIKQHHHTTAWRQPWI